MDRFIVGSRQGVKLCGICLKSNMDRFIATAIYLLFFVVFGLKSNMDRFIVITIKIEKRKAQV